MTNVNKTAASNGTNVYNQNVELVYFSNCAKAAQNDTVTITDASDVYWAHACIRDGSEDLSEDTVTIDRSADPGQVKLTSATTGSAHILVIMDRG